MCGWLKRHLSLEFKARQLLVEPALSLLCPRASAQSPIAHRRAGLCLRRSQQLLGGYGWNLDMQIDAVKQRPAQSPLVARHLVGGAATAALT